MVINHRWNSNLWSTFYIDGYTLKTKYWNIIIFTIFYSLLALEILKNHFISIFLNSYFVLNEISHVRKRLFYMWNEIIKINPNLINHKQNNMIYVWFKINSLEVWDSKHESSHTHTHTHKNHEHMQTCTLFQDWFLNLVTHK